MLSNTSLSMFPYVDTKIKLNNKFRTSIDIMDDEYLEVFGTQSTFQKVKSIVKKFSPEKPECGHKNIYRTDGYGVCKDCGCEVSLFDFEPEWRYYKKSDGGGSDPSRCHTRHAPKSLDKVYEDNNIILQDSIKAQIEQKYNKIVGKTTVRGKKRKGIVAACMFFVYMDFLKVRTTDFIRNKFGLDKKEMSEGLTTYYKSFPSDRKRYVRPKDLLKWIMDMTTVPLEHYSEILKLMMLLENTSVSLKRSTPQSVASSIVFYYLCLNPELKSDLKLDKKTFAEKARLSEITVSKLTKEISTITDTLISL